MRPRSRGAAVGAAAALVLAAAGCTSAGTAAAPRPTPAVRSASRAAAPPAPSALPPAPSRHVAAPVTIMPLGDSITYGATEGGDTPGGYRGFLDTDLSAARIPHRFVGSVSSNPTAALLAGGEEHHEGHIGYRLDQVGDNLDGDPRTPGAGGGRWLTGTPTRGPVAPQVVVVQVGTNDVAETWDPGGSYPSGHYDWQDPAQRGVFCAHFGQRYQALVEKIARLDPGVRVVVSDAPPYLPKGYVDPTMPVLAREVGEVVVPRLRAEGLPVAYAAVYAAFAGPDGRPRPGLLGSDTVHPSPAGYRLIGQVYAAAVQQVLSS